MWFHQKVGETKTEVQGGLKLYLLKTLHIYWLKQVNCHKIMSVLLYRFFTLRPLLIHQAIKYCTVVTDILAAGLFK